MVKLDRILASKEWEAKFPLCFAWSKARVGSDHCPIFLDSREGSMSKQKYFYFEKQWLLDEEFSDIFLKNLRASGEKTKNWKNSADIWHECLCRSRQLLRGWNANKKSQQLRTKTEMMVKLRKLDVAGES
jgi:hypothetical protein